MQDPRRWGCYPGRWAQLGAQVSAQPPHAQPPCAAAVLRRCRCRCLLARRRVLTVSPPVPAHCLCSAAVAAAEDEQGGVGTSAAAAAPSEAELQTLLAEGVASCKAHLKINKQDKDAKTVLAALQQRAKNGGPL